MRHQSIIRGNVLYARGHYNTAKISYESAISELQDDIKKNESDEPKEDDLTEMRNALADAYYGLGRVLLKFNNIDKAIANYTLAINCKPSHVEALMARYDTFKKAGRTKEAEKDRLNIQQIIDGKLKEDVALTEAEKQFCFSSGSPKEEAEDVQSGYIPRDFEGFLKEYKSLNGRHADFCNLLTKHYQGEPIDANIIKFRFLDPEKDTLRGPYGINNYLENLLEIRQILNKERSKLENFIRQQKDVEEKEASNFISWEHYGKIHTNIMSLKTALDHLSKHLDTNQVRPLIEYSLFESLGEIIENGEEKDNIIKDVNDFLGKYDEVIQSYGWGQEAANRSVAYAVHFGKLNYVLHALAEKEIDTTYTYYGGKTFFSIFLLAAEEVRNKDEAEKFLDVLQEKARKQGNMKFILCHKDISDRDSLDYAIWIKDVDIAKDIIQRLVTIAIMECPSVKDLWSNRNLLLQLSNNDSNDVEQQTDLTRFLLDKLKDLGADEQTITKFVREALEEAACQKNICAAESIINATKDSYIVPEAKLGNPDIYLSAYKIITDKPIYQHFTSAEKLFIGCYEEVINDALGEESMFYNHNSYDE